MRIWLTVTFITCFELYLKANDGHFDVTYGPGPDGSLRVSLTCRLTPDGVTTKRTTGVDIIWFMMFILTGPYQFRCRALATKTMPPFPRVGLRMRCPAEMQSVKWFGRGPHECYPDRKASAMIGLHSSSVEDMHVPYIVPSENGGRADVRWFSIRRASISQPSWTAEKASSSRLCAISGRATPIPLQGYSFHYLPINLPKFLFNDIVSRLWMQHPTRMSLKLHWMQVMVLCTFMWITCIWALGVMTAGHLMYTLSILLNRENPGAVVCTLPFCLAILTLLCCIGSCRVVAAPMFELLAIQRKMYELNLNTRHDVYYAS